MIGSFHVGHHPLDFSGNKDKLIQMYTESGGARFVCANYIKHDIKCYMVTFWMTLFLNKWTNTIMDGGWVRPPAKTLPSLVNILWWNIVMDDWNLDEKSLGKW